MNKFPTHALQAQFQLHETNHVNQMQWYTITKRSLPYNELGYTKNNKSTNNIKEGQMTNNTKINKDNHKDHAIQLEIPIIEKWPWQSRASHVGVGSDDDKE